MNEEMIQIAAGFQYSVNLRYDLGRQDKLENFVPTRSALEFLLEIMKSTRASATDRARVLIGAYGKGKSHMVLMALSLLLKVDRTQFFHLLPKLHEDKELASEIDRYYASEGKILPVIISGSYTSIPQAFLSALEYTLKENQLLDIMPETNYQAAIRCIHRWKENYPETYRQFMLSLQDEPKHFLKRLADYDIDAYANFEQLYPQLTAGSMFNPFVGFDIAEIYSSVAHSLQARGYQGLYVVYDEFSKYLETNIQTASVSDTKMLQDFAEKCNRSGKEQLHLLLISHKEIANYIDKLPKQKTDGWRGVSERFHHMHMQDDYSQSYELIAAVIQKDSRRWSDFTTMHHDEFTALVQQYRHHLMFKDLTPPKTSNVILAAYPLQPLAVFLLPRLSERIAQNERTMFTFLSADGRYTLKDFLRHHTQKEFSLLTADGIYDYFLPLLEKESYTGTIHQQYLLAQNILQKLSDNILQQKIIKTLALIYMVEQFDVLPPIQEEIINSLRMVYSVSEIEQALDDLIEQKYVVYLKRSNGYLCLKQSTGINIEKKLADFVAAHQELDIRTLLNQLNFDHYIYPARYNDEREMTRYFAVKFVLASELQGNVSWEVKSEQEQSDGIIYAILLENAEDLSPIKNLLVQMTAQTERFVFVLPKKYMPIRDLVLQLYAADQLREATAEDHVLYDEYNLVYEDLYVLVRNFIQSYIRPELHQASYYHIGKQVPIRRRSELSALLSDICDTIYPLTPVINNEIVNKHELTSMAMKSRRKVLAAILRPETEPQLGLIGSGQDTSIMRSVLLRTGILTADATGWKLQRHTDDKAMDYVLDTIYDFVSNASEQKAKCFTALYHQLTAPEGKIGLREGIIPLLLAVVFRNYRKSLLIYEGSEEVPLQADTLEQINIHPEDFLVKRLNWTTEKAMYLQAMQQLFSIETTTEDYEGLMKAMQQWYLALPKYTKEMQITPAGQLLGKQVKAFRRSIRMARSGSKLLFVSIPTACNIPIERIKDLLSVVKDSKQQLDDALECLTASLADKLRHVFGQGQSARASLTAILFDWCNQLSAEVFTEVFADGTAHFLKLCKQGSSTDAQLVRQIARETTGLRLEDWDDQTKDVFIKLICQYKETAENYQPEIKNTVSSTGVQVEDGYLFVYPDTNGRCIQKHFSKVNYSPRAKLLHNSITSDLEAMGQAISEEEKRQVLADILQELC